MSSPVPGTAPPGPLLPAGNPRIVAVVNITEDSFSDGGRYLEPAAALAHARRLRAEGADVIELGPAASHPGSAPVTVAEERRRLAPVLEGLAEDGIAVSVDSARPETQLLPSPPAQPSSTTSTGSATRNCTRPWRHRSAG
jgi:dihydropteroate synthase